MFEKYGLSIGPMMLWSSIFALAFGIAGSFATLEVFGAIDFMRENPSILQVRCRHDHACASLWVVCPLPSLLTLVCPPPPSRRCCRTSS